MNFYKFCSLLVITSLCGFSASSQTLNRTNIDDSTCIVNVQDSEQVTVGDVCSDVNARKVNVRFVWLDQDQYAFLRVGYVQPKAYFLFGESPNLLKNRVHSELEEIYSEFGARISSNRLVEQFRDPTAIDIVQKGVFPTFTDGVWEGDVPPLTSSQLRSLRVLNAHGPIIWPDVEYLNSLNEGSLYTEGYEYRLNYYKEYFRNLGYKESFHFLGNRRQFSRSIQEDLEDGGSDPVVAYCLLATRWVSRDEFLGYWNTVDQLFEQYVEPFEYFPLPDNQFAFDRNDAEEFNEFSTVLGRYGKNSFKYGGFVELYSDVYSNPSYDLIEYVTESGWPEDYLVLEGAFRDADRGNDCGGIEYSGRANLNAIPRDLSVLVAVFEAATDDPVTISKVTARIDDQNGLRKLLADGSEITFDVGEEVLTRSGGERLVVPLQMEFIYDHEEAFVLGENIANRIRLDNLSNEQRSIDLLHCDYDWSCGIFASMDASRISTKTSPIASSSYIFGPAIRLSNFQINGGDEFKIRDVPEVATYSKYSYGYGSCPYLYFVHHDGSETLHGRILVGASSPEKAMNEDIKIPEDVVAVIIKEIEPEVSFISGIDVKMEDGSSQSQISSPIVLKPQQGYRFSVPENADSIKISGYYETL